MGLNNLKDDELELLDSKGVEALSDEALERLDAEEKVKGIPASSTIESPLDLAKRVNRGIEDAVVAVARPIAAPVDAAIARVDAGAALPRIPTTEQTPEGEVHGDLLPDLMTQVAGHMIGVEADKIASKLTDGLPSLAKRGMKDIVSGAMGLGGGLGGAMRVAGFENIGQLMAKSAQETAKNLMPPDPTIVDQVASGLGSMTAFMVPGLGVSSSATAVATVAPRLAMFLGVATSSVLEAGVEAGDVFNRVMEKTGDRGEANVAAGRTFFANLPLLHYTNKLGWAGDQASRAARALESFLTEGLQEGGQQLVSNFTANDPLMKGVVESAFVGGIVGGAAGALIHGPVHDIHHPGEVSPGAPPAGPGASPAASAELVAAQAQEQAAPPIAKPEEVLAAPEPPAPEPKKGKKKPAKAEIVEGADTVDDPAVKKQNEELSAADAKYEADEKVRSEKAVGSLKEMKAIFEEAQSKPAAERAALVERYASVYDRYHEIETDYRGDEKERKAAGYSAMPPEAIARRQTSSEEMAKSPEFKAAVKEAIDASSTRAEFREKLAEIVFSRDIPASRMLLTALQDTKAADKLGVGEMAGHGETLGGSEFSGQNRHDELERVTKPMLEKMRSAPVSKEKSALLKKFAAKLDSILPDTDLRGKNGKGKKKAGMDDITAKTRSNLLEAARMGEISEDVVRAIAESGKVTSDGSSGLRGHIQISTKGMDIDLSEGYFNKEIKVSKSNTELMARAAALEITPEMPPSVNEKTKADLVKWVRESTVGWRGSEEHVSEVRWVIDNFATPAEDLLKSLRNWSDSGNHPAADVIHLRGEAIIKELGWPTNDAALYRNKHVGSLEDYKNLIEPKEEAVTHRGETRDDNVVPLLDHNDPVTDPSTVIQEHQEAVDEAAAEAAKKLPKREKAAADARLASARKELKEVKEKLAAPGAVTPGAKPIAYTEADIPPAKTVRPVENVVGQLEKAGYEPKTARTLAVVFEGFQVLADRAGIAAHKLFDRYGVRIVKSEAKKTGAGAVLEQPAYHGSPHVFEKFDLQKIGSGEGAQSYGWGLYFAGRKEIAEHYRDILSSQTRRVPSGLLRELATLDNLGFDTAAQAIDAILKHDDWETRWDVEGNKTLKSLIDEYKASKDIRGRLYKVDIPEDDAYFDWDKPLKEQTDVMKKAGVSFLDVMEYSSEVTPRGHTLYDYLTKKLGGPEEASRFLASKGFAGIKYLDAASRARGEGISNYVVFDDKLVKIEDFEQSGANGPRGRLRIEGRQFTIEMLEDADLSTFLHESGHLYLEVLGDIAADPAAAENIKADYAAILDWLGAKTREDIKVDQHEQFARGFEAYLMEGKAPTQRLRLAFETFKEWLGAIYKQLSALDVNLTPEVRRVFDRMLASDAELAVELQSAEKALANARKRRSEADSQAPPQVPQDAAPAARAAVVEESTRVKKAKEKAKPIARMAEKPGDGAKIEGVKRSVVESMSEIGALIESKEPMTQLKPAKLERFVNAGLLDTEFRVTPLARKAVAELARLKQLLKTGYVSDLSVVEPPKLTLKSFLKSIADNGRFGLLNTYDIGWLTDGRIMFRTAKEDEATFATFRHLAKDHQAPMMDAVIKSAEPATDQVTAVLGAHQADSAPTYLLGTEGGRQIEVAASYYNFFKERYPDAKIYAQGQGMALKVEVGGQMVGALMPMKSAGPYTVFSREGEKTVVESPKGRLEVDAKMAEIAKARNALDFSRKVQADNVKEIRELDQTPGEKTAALIAKIASIQKENVDLDQQMTEQGKALSLLEEQADALRAEYGVKDIPSSGLVKKGKPKGYKGGKAGADKGDFAYNTPVELGGMDHVKPFRMPEMVRLAYELMGRAPDVIGKMSAETNGFFRPRGDGEIALNPEIFKKPEQAAKTLAHEIGHLTDYLPEHTMKRGNLLGSLLSLRDHLANTFGTLQVTNKDLREELLAVTDYWRPWDPGSSSASYKSYRRSARELYADAISVMFNSPGTLERMAPKFYAGFFTALDQKPAVKLAFFNLQALLNSTEMEIQEARHLDRKAMYLTAEDLWALKRKEQETREAHYGEWFKQLVVEKHQKAIGMAEAAASKGQPLPPSADPRYILEELSLADNSNHAFLEEVDSSVVKPLNDAEVTLLDMGDYLYLSRVSEGDRQAFANPKGYHPEEAKKALDYMGTRLGAERYAKLQAAAAAFREVVFKLSEKAVEVGAYNKKVFDEKIKPNRGSYAVFAVQDYLEDYIAAGVKEQVGTLKDIANPFTATIMKMVALNRLIAKQQAANVMRDFLLPRGEAEKAVALNPQDNLVQFRQKKGKGLLELLEDGHRAAYHVDPYIAEAFKKKEAGTFQLATKMLDSVFNGVFRPLYITYNVGFQLYSNPLRDFQRAKRNVYALMKNEGYVGTVKSLMLSYFDSLTPAAKRSMDIPDSLVSEMIANKSLDITFTDFSFDPEADQYTSILRKMGVAPPQQSGLFDKLSKSKALYPLVKILEAIRFVGNTHETASKIAGYKVLKSDSLKTLDAAIRGETDEKQKAFLVEQRKLLEKGEGEYAHQLAYNTRNYVGTPNWRRRGVISQVTNTIFPFSNIMVQGMRSDLEIATRPETRSAFMFDMVLTQVLPKVLMFMAAMGGAGDDLEEFFRKVSEYDKSNYLVVPMGWSYDEKGGRKAVYWRIPHDESGRLIAAVTWKMMNAMRGDPKQLQQIVDFGAGQLPNLSPPLTIGANWVSYLSGKNPYDDFRGRPIMADKVYKAGGRYALTAMVKWTVNAMGLASFATHDDAKKSEFESMMEVAPLLNRIIKISDYGEHEESMKTISAKQAEDAALSLDRGQAAVSYTKERYILSQKLAADEISTDERTRLARLNKYLPIYSTYTKAIKRANDKGDQDKVEHYRERLDGILAKVVQ